MSDFESELQKQTVRPVPPHWKRQILSAAQHAAAREQSSGWSWRALFWPCPQMWAGLAAAWLLVLVLNLASHPSDEPAEMALQARTVPMEGYSERQRLLAELLEEKQPNRPDPFVPRRRSEGVIVSAAA